MGLCKATEGVAIVVVICYLDFTNLPIFSGSPLKALQQAMGCTTVQV